MFIWPLTLWTNHVDSSNDQSAEFRFLHSCESAVWTTVVCLLDSLVKGEGNPLPLKLRGGGASERQGTAPSGGGRGVDSFSPH